jgi:hypothetical protein
MLFKYDSTHPNNSQRHAPHGALAIQNLKEVFSMSAKLAGLEKLGFKVEIVSEVPKSIKAPKSSTYRALFQAIAKGQTIKLTYASKKEANTKSSIIRGHITRNKAECIGYTVNLRGTEVYISRKK